MSTTDKYTREQDKRFTLRIDKNLFSEIERSAKRNKRSIGREIEFILSQHFENKNHKE
ncbi:Arc family DNA-binding protein [Staphylococcus aureus]|uniref:Arc family DNA-binding protein n=1 Tax=Staphylococcus aureus TaxID=1280 RepID=UPI0018D6712F|nr:Arc family DNA-binding protein [Staphylococcus aureus]MBH4710955.1 Arc family DNA-binding protein [Staphylococcus aureus]MBH4716294.1 Arc family DNA-binding protein [Staphylococcus aureus]MBH4719667.1 Arc family DNA-binding protein [Staphylococcus aureus]MBH4722029.1 Arc family DNA-binding protein [Staphylococcus aureus]MBH4724692.1 Arc family DNA-binding protein [Staphylococcus aureus]